MVRAKFLTEWEVRYKHTEEARMINVVIELEISVKTDVQINIDRYLHIDLFIHVFIYISYYTYMHTFLCSVRLETASFSSMLSLKLYLKRFLHLAKFFFSLAPFPSNGASLYMI